MLGTGVCRRGSRASEEVVGLGKEDSTKVGKSRQNAVVSEAGERVPSNPWGTGLRMEYYSFVRRRLHFLVEVFFISKRVDIPPEHGKNRSGKGGEDQNRHSPGENHHVLCILAPTSSNSDPHIL